METIFERVGALDVHKAQVTARVRIPDACGRREAHLAEFATTVQGLLALAAWLKAFAVTNVAMEATGGYWQPVWHILEDDFELVGTSTRQHRDRPRSCRTHTAKRRISMRRQTVSWNHHRSREPG